jgi:IS5 family transposase
MSVRIVITDLNTADCTQASKLINGIKAEYLLADKCYDTDEILVQAESQGRIAVNRQGKTERFSGNMTRIYTSGDIL